MPELEELQQKGIIRPLDLHLAKMLARMHPKMQNRSALAIALTSWATSQGHTCLPLGSIRGLAESMQEKEMQKTPWPRPSLLRKELLACGAVSEAQAKSLSTPLVLDEHNQLALLRYHLAEKNIANALCTRSRATSEVDIARASEQLARLFPAPDEAKHSSSQKIAAALALLKPLFFLFGGPGTGKTYTLARILCLLSSMKGDGDGMHIALTAPTGKAALRLYESIRLAETQVPNDMKAYLPQEALTLHRLLGYQPAYDTFLYNESNLLPVDLLVVAGVSMVDAALMNALLKALSPNCRLILCGDPEQLPSVEAGNVLKDISRGIRTSWSSQIRDLLSQLIPFAPGPELSVDGAASPLADCLVTLDRGYRFEENSGIHQLAEHLRQSPNQITLQAGNHFAEDVHIYSLNAEKTKLHASLTQLLAPLNKVTSPEEALQVMVRGRILCALREGPWGVSGMNARCQHILQEQGISLAQKDWYKGLPVQILRNDYSLNLYNGDTGIVWPAAQGQLYAWFPEKNGLRQLARESLPPWQASYAMTVHKAQGTEFDCVLLVLPPEDSPVLCRELLYTAVTRAKKKLFIFSESAIIEKTVSRETLRYSGLGQMLAACDA